MKLNIHALAMSTLAFLAAGSPALTFASEDAAHSVPRDELQSWIARNAVAVRSVDPKDEDFKDLEFLVDIIGGAQVVELGEVSHVAGNGFAAKARLVEFLHQRMGFDVLVWEAGLYDVRLTQAGLKGSEDPLAAAQRGISRWSSYEQVKPLIAYVKASESSTRPLEMAGYDILFSPQSFEHFASSLRSFVAALRDGLARERSQALVESAIAAYNRICCAKDVRAGQKEDLDNLRRTVEALLKEIDTNRGLFEQTHGALEISFMERAIESMHSDGVGKFYLAQMTSGGADNELYFSKFWHQRDEQGARNLRWLIEKEYPGRKVIFWAHNAHVTKAYFGPAWKTLYLEPRPDAMKPVGVYLTDWLGDRVYSIGMANFDGKEKSLANDDVVSIPPAPSGSLEARLHALGKPYLFLNLRAVDSDQAHPLHKPESLRVLVPSHMMFGGSGNYVTDVTRVFDGLFYIDRLTPATRTPEP